MAAPLCDPTAAPPTYFSSPSGAGFISNLGSWNVDCSPHDFGTMFNNILSVLYSSILAVTAAVFITGAFMYIIGSFGKEDLKSNGKSMMIGSLVGMSIVLFAKFIVGLTLYFMYAGSL
jgi:membrane protein insertase Oxa1/YidC/SpoIIIJ